MTKYRSINLDLASNDSYTELANLLKKENPEVKLLINNAGYERTGT